MTDVLGYARYGAQGGDFGAQVTSRLGRDHGGHRGRHPPEPDRGNAGAGPQLGPAHPAEEAFLAKAEHFFTKEGAYAQIQGSRPATLAAGLSDSQPAWPRGS